MKHGGGGGEEEEDKEKEERGEAAENTSKRTRARKDRNAPLLQKAESPCVRT